MVAPLQQAAASSQAAAASGWSVGGQGVTTDAAGASAAPKRKRGGGPAEQAGKDSQQEGGKAAAKRARRGPPTSAPVVEAESEDEEEGVDADELPEDVEIAPPAPVSDVLRGKVHARDVADGGLRCAGFCEVEQPHQGCVCSPRMWHARPRAGGERRAGAEAGRAVQRRRGELRAAMRRPAGLPTRPQGRAVSFDVM